MPRLRMTQRLTCYLLLLAWCFVSIAGGEEPAVRFSERLIADKYGYTFGVAAYDLDGDGDLDLTNVDIVGKNPSAASLLWFENDGKGAFRRHVIHEKEDGWLERHSIGDLNGDGRPDIAVVSNRDGLLLWFEHPGENVTGTWKRHVITTNCPKAYDVVLADIDGDGDVDAASAGYVSGTIAWYENPGSDRLDREWPKHVIDTTLTENRTIRLGDFNRDDHNACHYIQTGHPLPPAQRGAAMVDATEKDWPAMGSVVEYLDQQAGAIPPGGPGRDFPSYVYLPNPLGHIQGYDRSGQYAGWLGRSYNALATKIAKRDKDDNPYFRECADDELDFRVQGCEMHEGMTLDRNAGRVSLLEQFDEGRRMLERSRSVLAYNRVQQRALDLVTSEKMRNAFDIRQEAASLRDRYGRHLFGQSAMMGRRMLEAGARFVTVLWDCPDGYSWDSHRNSNDVGKYLLPGLDQTFSALLEDLEDRGLLDETLVVCVGEMGRTPKRDTAEWGRGHWSYCFPAVLAGAGVRGGIVYGQSDAQAGYPTEKPVTPEQLTATIFHALGIPPETRILDALNRPFPVVDRGQPLLDLFG
ncbi:MAG: DUF1501 domain-containing protein [Planctomycetota bacterium]|nr:DUF1501 domain-containing protein [Planctomycetota bacterium]